MTSREKILDAYKIAPTINGIKKITGYCWQKIAKVLSTEGIIVSDNQALFIELAEKGMSVKEISKRTGYAESTIMAYLPRVRPVYNENPSRNAIKIKKCRERKNNTTEAL